MATHTGVIDHLYLFVVNSIRFLASQKVDLTAILLIQCNLGVKIWTNLYRKFAFFKNPRWRSYWRVGKWKHAFSDSLFYAVSKNI